MKAPLAPRAKTPTQRERRSTRAQSVGGLTGRHATRAVAGLVTLVEISGGEQTTMACSHSSAGWVRMHHSSGSLSWQVEGG